MNPVWFGDSYDIVKRYFADILKAMGYTVYAEPMFTVKDGRFEKKYFEFIGVEPLTNEHEGKSVLLVDPDTGIGSTRSPKHVLVDDLVEYSKHYEIVLTFDQSFSRGSNAERAMSIKLGKLEGMNCHGFYYDSHARFLFCAKNKTVLRSVATALKNDGMPMRRIFVGRKHNNALNSAAAQPGTPRSGAR